MAPPVTRRTPAASTAAVRRPTPTASRAPARGTPVASGYRGAEGLRKMREEQERAEARRGANAALAHQPFRFYVPPGETRELIVVDDRPDFFRHEHNLKGPDGKWTIFAPCINEHANCPICIATPDKPAYFAMYLTVIDLTPYVSRDNREVEWSKKLLVVKQSMQKKFMRQLERNGTLRGLHIALTRDGEKDAAIGNDMEVIEVLSDEELEAYVTSYTDKQGKEVEVVGYEPFDYDELFPAQTEEMLAALVGGRVNNYESSRRSVTGRSAREDDDDGWEAGGSRTGRAPASRRPAAGPGRVAASRRDPEPLDDEDEEAAPEEQDPPPRPRLARPGARPAPRVTQEMEDEDPPQRAVSTAARRAQLRGR